MGKKDSSKPRGRMSSYAFFVQTCREEHKKKCPDENVVFAEFTKKCANKWKEMSAKEKRRFEEMAEKDKVRYEREMANYDPPPGDQKGGKKRKRTKDPNAPKRSLSAFFFFCAAERPKVRQEHPDFTVAEVAKALGKKWEQCKDKSTFESQASADKKRYEREMAAYKGGASPAKRAAPSKPAVVEDDDDEEEEDEDEEDDDDE